MNSNDFIFICHLGGKVQTTNDGSLTYVGGDAHAINFKIGYYSFNDFKKEVAEAFKCNVANISEFKYLYPGRKTLITVSSDKDLDVMKRVHVANDKDVKAMKKSYMESAIIDVYAVTV